MLFAAGKQIEVGHHPVINILGLDINLDILASSLLAATIVITLFIFGARAAKKNAGGVPSKFQLAFEILIEQIGGIAESSIGSGYKRFLGIGVTLFTFILTCNWLGALPAIPIHWHGHEYEILPPPTSDVNLPFAMAIVVIVWVNFESIRARGIGGYFKHFTQPFAMMTPINLIEEIIKPVTMTFRLFGNLFSGVLMVMVMTVLLPVYVVPLGEIIWKPFDMGIGVIQAFIFTLLTMLYMGMAMSHHGSDEHTDSSH